MAENGETRSPTSHRTPGQILRHGRTYQASKQQRKNRALRNAARKKLGLKKGDPRDAGHKRSLMKGGTNDSSNISPQSVAKNRGHGTSGNGRIKRGKY